MKNILKISSLVLMSAVFVWFLSNKNIIDFALIKHAFTNNLWIIFGIIVLQMINYFAMGLRYATILNILGLNKKTTNVIEATFVSNGIGQWLPGSLAFIEVIRVGLMNRSSNKIDTNVRETGVLAIASLLDRLVGLLVGLFIGTFVAIYFLFSLKNITSANYLILLFVLTFNGLISFLILILPFFAGSKFMQQILIKGEILCLRLISKTTLENFVRKIFHKINGLIKLVGDQKQNYKLFLTPIALSTCSMFGFAFSIQLASFALGNALPFLSTLALISLLSLIVALPLSIGGIGVPQLIAAILYGAFGADSATAASAQLLQTGLTLIIISLCAVSYLPRIIKEMIRPRIA